MMIHQDVLDEGKIEELVSALRAIDPSSPELADKIRVEAGYFENNLDLCATPTPRAAPVCGHGCYRSRMQNPHWLAL